MSGTLEIIYGYYLDLHNSTFLIVSNKFSEVLKLEQYQLEDQFKIINEYKVKNPYKYNTTTQLIDDIYQP